MLNTRSDLTGQRLIDLVYAAGYLDAEGCFRYNNTATISISNTYPYTLMFMRRMFGGSIRTKTNKPNARTAYDWSIFGDNARTCAELTIPFLREKRPQAEIMLDLGSYPKKSVRRNQLKKLLSKKKKIDYTSTRMSKETAWMRNEHF
jgi:hypothetical protein